MKTSEVSSSAMIVPTRSGSKGADADVLLKRWGGQSWLPDELIVVRGASNPAVARNLGAASTAADLLIFADDDGWPCHPNTLELIVGTLIGDDTVWLSGAAIQPPRDSSLFQNEYARQIPQNAVEIPANTVDSNFAYSLCCAIRKRHFDRLNGFDERLTAGEDSDLRDRLREAGGRVVLAGGAGVYHPPPPSLRLLWRRGFWYGKGEAQIAVLFRNDRWRGETRPKRLDYILLKALISPACLLLDWEKLRERKIGFGFQPLRLLHIWAMTCGYIAGRVFKAGNNRECLKPEIERYRFMAVQRG